jgi:hypothetical protein
MASVTDMTSQAGFVFEGQVVEPGASAASGFAATPESAVVRVTRILKSTPALAMYTGQQITVQLQQPGSLKAGEQAVFFTHGIHFGDGLVVSELGNVPAGDSTMQQQVNSAAQSASDTELTQRLAQASLVVSGVASAPTPLVPAAGTISAAVVGTGRRPVSEHDPDWWQTIIKVGTVEKGADPGATMNVIFPHSMDIAWYRSPKVKEGDSGMWLLHNRDLYGRPVPAHAIVHPLDFQPEAAMERVRSLLRGSQ